MNDYEHMTDEELEAVAQDGEAQWVPQQKIVEAYGNGHWRGGGEIVIVADKDSIHGKGGK